MEVQQTWEPFGIPDHEYLRGAGGAEAPRTRILSLSMRRARREPGDRSSRWLGSALAGLGVLALSAAAVSYTAQYEMVRAVKHLAVISSLEAGIPDVGSMIFACLGIALALRGRRAIRARALNVACVGLSLGMNALAASPGWRDLAIWVMPSAVYALASDTLIGVVRAWAIAQQREMADADDEATPLAMVGGLLLWLLRLALAPRSTVTGFRRWVVDETPVAPGRRQEVPPGEDRKALPPPGKRRKRPRPERASSSRRTGKTAGFLSLVTERHGPLAGIDLALVGRISSDLAAEASLNEGAARKALRAAVIGAQAGGAA
jgi:hypothetical protein